MIPARKIGAFNFALRPVMNGVLRRRFHNIRVAGVEHLAALDPVRPVVGCMNHTNWWDGFVLYALSHALVSHDIHLAMEERNLRRYPFFPWMGAFGLDLDDPLAGLRYAVRLLRGAPGRLAWMFVQGRLAPAHVPIEAKPGALWLAEKAGAQVLPLVIRYEWLVESRPTILVRIGAALPAETTAAQLSAVMNGLFSEIDAALDPIEMSEYQPLFRPRMSMNRRWDYFVHRVLGRREAFERENG